jgi:diaminopimelate decarboxylase
VGRRAPISIRVNPDVDAETHPYISTGLKKNKFGIPHARAREAYRSAAQSPHLDVVGIDCHIGSQLTKVTPFRDAVARVATLIEELASDGIRLHHVDIGGGLGIPYNAEEPPSPAEYGQAVTEALAPLSAYGLTLVCEPGRVIVGNAGLLLTKVLYRKQGEAKNFVIVDAAMNDLIRPSFYDSFHQVVPVRKGAEATGDFVADIVGPICETGDFLARDRAMVEPAQGDLLAVLSAGAYGFSMASNYNTRGRAAEVMVRGDAYAVVRARETYEDQVRNESIPDLVG